MVFDARGDFGNVIMFTSFGYGISIWICLYFIRYHKSKFFEEAFYKLSFLFIIILVVFTGLLWVGRI
jgi:hypothetical protein